MTVGRCWGLADGVDGELDGRAEDFVPPENGVKEPSAAFETACAAERVGERGIGGEVVVDGRFLLFG